MSSSIWFVSIWQVNSCNAWQLQKLPGEENSVMWENVHEVFSLCEKNRLQNSIYSVIFLPPLPSPPSTRKKRYPCVKPGRRCIKVLAVASCGSVVSVSDKHYRFSPVVFSTQWAAIVCDPHKWTERVHENNLNRFPSCPKRVPEEVQP